MNRSTEPDFDQRIADWLEDDPNHAPRLAIDTVLAAYPSIPQRRAWRVPWRYITMTIPMRLATAVILGLLAIGGAYYSEPTRPTRSRASRPDVIGVTSPAPTLSSVSDVHAAEGGSGSAHYEITGPDAASGDADVRQQHSSTRLRTRSASPCCFQDGSLVIKIKFPPPGLRSFPPCGTVDISTADSEHAR